MDGVTIIETKAFQELLSKIDSMNEILKSLDQEIKDNRKPYLTVAEVSELTGFSKSWVNDHKFDIGCSSIGGSLRFKRKDVDWLMQQDYFKIPKKRNNYPY